MYESYVMPVTFSMDKIHTEYKLLGKRSQNFQFEKGVRTAVIIDPTANICLAHIVMQVITKIMW